MSRAFFLWVLVFLSLKVAVEADELRLVQLSDIHSGGPHFSESAFQEACQQALSLQPQGVLLTGDHADNSFDRKNFDQRFVQDVGRWKQALQGYTGQVFLTLGNDDYTHNYQTEPDDLQATYKTLQETLGSRCYLNELGNGVAPVQLGGFLWVSLNSQVFSPLNGGAEAPQQAQDTLVWLEQQLEGWQGPVVLLCHIPPSWDLYLGKPGWKPEYLRRLADILQDYPSQVLILSGHFHRNHVQAMRPSRPIPILTGGALATKYGYQPNWRSYRWTVRPGQGASHIAYTLHYPGHPEWTRSYELVPDRIRDFLDLLQRRNSVYRDYVQDIYGHHTQWEDWAEQDSIRTRIEREFWVDPGLDS